MKLFLVHCGFYDPEVCGGLYESHANFYVVAENVEAARLTAKKHELFQQKKMHIDGLQEVHVVSGWKVRMERTTEFGSETILVTHHFRELAPRPNNSANNGF